jgi:MazG family protein
MRNPHDLRLADRHSIETLLKVMAKLRDPEGGCPWDREQNFDTIAPYTVEEAYEVAEAISRKDMQALVDELGDLLFQVVFHAQMAKEEGRFDFGEVVAAIVDKMIRRHPHVFGDETVADAKAQSLSWEAHKAEERRGRGDAAASSRMDHVPKGLPAIKRAQKLQTRAARVGFDWPSAGEVVPKLREELAELTQAMETNASRSDLQEEMGDLLFSCINLARHLSVDAEMALRGTTTKFEQRFRWMEAELEGLGRSVESADAEELETLWSKAKKRTR